MADTNSVSGEQASHAAAGRRRCALAFLAGGGELGDRIAAFDWSTTSLGSIEQWPPAMTSVVGLILRSPVPIVTLWGKAGVMIYNDAYRGFAGARHPGLLGMAVLQGWHEVADFNAHVMQKVFREGGTLSFKDQELVLDRDGTPQTLWADLEYSPAIDESGTPIGVVAIVVETTQKVLAGQRARDERRWLLQMAEHSPSFMALLEGPGHRFTMVNPAFQRLVGDRPLLGHPIAEALPDAAEQGLVRRLDGVFASGAAVTSAGDRFLIQPQPGNAVTEKFVDYVLQPVVADGAVVGVFVSGVDVTDRTRAHAQSTADRDRLWTMSRDLMLVCTLDGVITAVNPSATRMLGWAQDELIGATLMEFIHPDDLNRTAAEVAKLGGGETTLAFENRYRTKQGGYRLLAWTAVPDADRIHAVGRDITEERQLARDRERIWTLSPVLKVVADEQGLITNVNPSWTATVGWTREETIGRRSTDFMIDDAANWAERVRTLATGTPLLEYETTLRTKDGEQRLIRWTTVPEDGRFYGFGRDITAEAEATAALADTEAALRQSQKMEAVGQLTGGIAHDFNNLLQGITGSLEIVKRRVAQGRIADLDRFITGASTAANRAAALTHRLLAFSRRQPLDPKPVRANALVASMEDLMRRTIGERVDLEMVLAGGPWVTKCDPNQLESAILNLVINARDAMPDGGKLTIETCNAHLDKAYAARQRGVRPGQYVCICVTDTGTGMDADTIAKAFEPFFTTKPIGQGTGLGLSMIYGFAQQSEGYAKIYSEVGEGTTFKLYLPRHRGAAEEDEQVPQLTEAHLAHDGDVVLVVEDEPVVRGLILEELKDLGYLALEAVDGPSGVEMLRSRRRIDLLITDIGLPGLNGRQVADAGRALRPGLKVLFMTGYAENAALASGFLEPGMAMITKPFAMEALATRIRAMIEGIDG